MEFNKTIAVHEAGHAVVAFLLGFHEIHFTMTPEGPATGFSAPENPSSIEHWVMAVISMAGGVAQNLMEEPLDDACLEDLNLAAEHLTQYLGLEAVPTPDSGILDGSMRRASELAWDILNSRWKLVLALAGLVIIQGGEVSVEEVAELMEDQKFAPEGLPTDPDQVH